MAPVVVQRSTSFGQCVTHTATRDFSKPFSASYFDSLASSSSRNFSLSLSLSLAPSSYFRTETTSPSHHDNLADRGLNAILCVFDVTLDSSTMFSSLFAVVQSSEPHYPPNLAWGSSDDFFFRVTALSPISVADFLFTCFCNPPVYPSSVVPCHSAPLRVVPLTHLLPSGREPSASLAYRLRSSPIVTMTLGTIVFTLRVILTCIDTFSQPPHLSGESLLHITLCISATSFEGLVSSTPRSSSTQRRLPINSSSLTGLFLELSPLPGSPVTLASFSLVLYLAARSPGCWVS